MEKIIWIEGKAAGVCDGLTVRNKKRGARNDLQVLGCGGSATASSMQSCIIVKIKWEKNEPPMYCP
jgi:hypothetical protein